MVRKSNQADEKTSGRSRHPVLLDAQRQFLFESGAHRPDARHELDSGQQIRSYGFGGSESRSGRLEGGRRSVEFCRRWACIIRLEGGISQSQERVYSRRKPAPCRNPRQEYKTIDHAPVGCGHLSGGGLRSGSVDSRESGQNPFSSSQRLVTGTGEGLHGSVRRRCCRVEKHFRSSRKRGRGGILSAGAGRQPVFRTRDRAPRIAVLPAPPSSITPSGCSFALSARKVTARESAP